MMTLKKNLFVKYRTLNESGFLIKNNQAYQIDEVGILIWENIDGINNEEDIINIVSAKFNKEKKDIESDVKEFIKELYKNKLIE
ncbi:MAG: PqqD family protein [Corynebacterium sp.]|jgi:hypothetical protein|nr:PqqD family protein [Corynebacterium sp.]